MRATAEEGLAAVRNEPRFGQIVESIRNRKR